MARLSGSHEEVIQALVSLRQCAGPRRPLCLSQKSRVKWWLRVCRDTSPPWEKDSLVT